VKNRWPHSVRDPAYLATAPKQTVSLTINSDLMARVKSLGINASRIAEEALAQELDRQRRTEIEAEMRQDMAAIDAYEQKYGSFTDHARAHYGDKLQHED
jgi:post-segregation antitoxin (ccd killing protein)